jgi:hypothetical protein
MSQIVIEIDGQKEEAGALWVHFQEPTRSPSFNYRIIVPSEHLRHVFDPLSTGVPDKPWVEHLNELVGEFGTFVVEGYIANIAKLAGTETKGYRWVIATVDSIRGVAGGIELVGKALRFDPSGY